MMWVQRGWWPLLSRVMEQTYMLNPPCLIQKSSKQVYFFFSFFLPRKDHHYFLISECQGVLYILILVVQTFLGETIHLILFESVQIRHRIRFLGRRCGINVEFRKSRGPSHPLFNLQVELTPRTQAETIPLRCCWEGAGRGTWVYWSLLILTQQSPLPPFLPNSVFNDVTLILKIVYSGSINTYSAHVTNNINKGFLPRPPPESQLLNID